jgi:hypothetical protein
MEFLGSRCAYRMYQRVESACPYVYSFPIHWRVSPQCIAQRVSFPSRRPFSLLKRGYQNIKEEASKVSYRVP